MVNSHGWITCPPSGCCPLLSLANPAFFRYSRVGLPPATGRTVLAPVPRVLRGFQEPGCRAGQAGCQPERRARFIEEGRMPILRKLQEFLEQNQVAYTHTVHPLAYTAREVAAAEHVPAREVAKTVIFLSEHGYGMAVLAGDTIVDLEQLR